MRMIKLKSIPQIALLAAIGTVLILGQGAQALVISSCGGASSNFGTGCSLQELFDGDNIVVQNGSTIAYSGWSRGIFQGRKVGVPGIDFPLPADFYTKIEARPTGPRGLSLEFLPDQFILFQVPFASGTDVFGSIFTTFSYFLNLSLPNSPGQLTGVSTEAGFSIRIGADDFGIGTIRTEVSNLAGDELARHEVFAAATTDTIVSNASSRIDPDLVGPRFAKISQTIRFGGIDDPQRDIVIARSFKVTFAVPEPSTLALFAIGLAGLGFFGWRRKHGHLIQAV